MAVSGKIPTMIGRSLIRSVGNKCYLSRPDLGNQTKKIGSWVSFDIKLDFISELGGEKTSQVPDV